MIAPLDGLAIKKGSKEMYMDKTKESVFMTTLKLTAMGVNREKKVVPPGSMEESLSMEKRSWNA